MNPEIRKPDELVFVIMYRNFPFLKQALENDPSLADDIRQTGWLAYYSTNNFRDFWNYCQRELYALAKALGLRRNKKNRWLRREVPAEENKYELEKI